MTAGDGPEANGRTSSIGDGLPAAWELWLGLLINGLVWAFLFLIIGGARMAAGDPATGPGIAIASVVGTGVLAGLAHRAELPWFALGFAGGWALLSLLSAGLCTMLVSDPPSEWSAVGALLYAALVVLSGAALALTSLVVYLRGRS